MNKSWLYVLALVAAFAQAEDGTKIDLITDIAQMRVNENVSTQIEIEKIADEVLNIEIEHKGIQNATAGLEIYNALLQQQIDDQIEEIAALSESINQISVVERHIIPLMVEMSKSGELYLQLARSYLDLSQWRNAIESIQKALNKQQRPEREDTVNMLLGTALYHEQEFGAAREAFVRAALDKRSAKLAGQWINHLDDEAQRKKTLNKLKS